MNKWWRMPMGVELSPERQQKTVNLIMAWIDRQLKVPTAGQSDSSSSAHVGPNVGIIEA